MIFYKKNMGWEVGTGHVKFAETGCKKGRVVQFSHSSCLGWSHDMSRRVRGGKNMGEKKDFLIRGG